MWNGCSVRRAASSAPFIVTEIDPGTGAMFARNPWSNRFAERVAFADLDGRQTAWTGDRTEFIGRDGALDRPLALTLGVALSNRVGAWPRSVRRPADADRVWPPASTTEIVFFLGKAADRPSRAILDRAIPQGRSRRGTRRGEPCSGTTCSAPCRSKTPDRALDIMLNRWLLYQTLACRIWARSGFYQASGAYGFRDQLQDVHGARAVAQPGRRARASCCARRRGNSSKATCSIGGCRIRAQASARGSPTTASGSPMPSRTTSR